MPWSYNKIGSVETKYTNGLEADAMVDFAINPNWHVGVGGRYWWLKSDYKQNGVEFDGTCNRYGLLAETKYRF